MRIFRDTLTLRFGVAAALAAGLIGAPSGAAAGFIFVPIMVPVEPCKHLVAFDNQPPERRELSRVRWGGRVDAFWALAKSDPKAASKLIRGDKTDGIKGADGALHPVGPDLLTGVTPLDGPFTLVKLTVEGEGRGDSRGVWKSADATGREVIQIVDFHIGWNNIRRDPLVIKRIQITDADHAPAVPDTICHMSDALPLW
jgi:hypothetical protein